MTGSYHNYFRIYDTDGKDDVILQADKSAFKTAKKIGTGGKGTPQKANGLGAKPALPSDAVDFSKKILHGSWHPQENTVAVSIVPPTLTRRGEMLMRNNDLDCGNEQPVHLERTRRLRHGYDQSFVPPR